MTEFEKGDEPFDRLTGLCNVMAEALQAATDREAITAASNGEKEPPPVQAIIFLSDDNQGGIEMYGFEDANSGMAALLVHLRALFEAHDKRMEYGVMTPQGLMILGLS